MQKFTKYELKIPPNPIKTKEAFSAFIESHSQVFETSVMAKYAGDTRYSYASDSFRVSEVESRCFSFEVDVYYYEGCKDRNGVDPVIDTVDFDIVNGYVVFELDETEWRTDN